MNPVDHHQQHHQQLHHYQPRASDSPPTPPSLPPSSSSSLSSLSATAAAMSSEQPTVPAGAATAPAAISSSSAVDAAKDPHARPTSSTSIRNQPISASFSLAPMTTTTVVTTTTTTSTEYPPLVFKPPPIPGHLDPRLFPLADTPTPHALKKFCFDLNGQPTFFRENHEGEQAMGQLEDALCNLSASAHQSAVRAFTDDKLRQRALLHQHQHTQDQQQQHLVDHHDLNEEHTTTRIVSAGKGNGKSIVTTTTRKTVINPRSILHPPGSTLLYGARKRPASPNTPVNSSNASSASSSSSSNTNNHMTHPNASSSSSAQAAFVQDRLFNKDRASPPHKKTKVPDRNESARTLSSSSASSSTARLASITASAPSASAFVTPMAPHRPRLHTTNHLSGVAPAGADGILASASTHGAASAISSTSSFVDSTNLPSPSLSPTTAHQAGIGSSTTTTTTIGEPSGAAGSARRFTASHPVSMYRETDSDAMDNDGEAGYPFGTILDHHHHHHHHHHHGDDTHLAEKDLEEDGDAIDGTRQSLDDALEEEVTGDEEFKAAPASPANSNHQAVIKASGSHTMSLMDLPALVQTYDALPASLQSYMLFQLLRRSPAPTLQFVSSVILNTMKYDFLALLPVELRLNVLKYLDAPSLCAAAQVSKTWRVAVDSDAHIWMNRIHKDGFLLCDNEEKEAQDQQLGIDGHYGPRPPYPIRMELMKRRQAKGKGRFQYPVAPRPTDLPESPFYPGDVSMKGDDDNDDTEMAGHEGGAGGAGGGANATAKSGWDSDTAGEEGEPMDESYGGGSADAAPPSPTTSHTGRLNAEYDDSEDDEMMEQDNLDQPFGPMDPSTPHPYKALYRRHWLIRQNWAKGRAKYIKFSGHSDRVVTCLEFDSDKIISGSDDRTIHVYDTLTGKRLKKFEDHEGGVWALKYRGNTLVSGSTDRTVRVWDIAAGKCTHVFQGHTSTVRCLQIVEPKNVNKDPRGPPKWEPEFPVIVTGSRDSTLRVWRLPDPELNGHIPPNDPSWLLHTLQGHNHSVRALAAEGSVLVSGSYDFSVRVWNLMTGSMVHRLQGHTSKVYSVVLDTERNQCMSGSMDARVRVWSLEDGSCLHELEGHTQLVGLLGLNAGHLVSAAADCTVRIWDPDRGVCLRILAAHAAAITCFQHDAYKVISGSDGNLKMWDFKTGKFIRNLLTGLSNVWQVRFDERRCVAAVQRDGATFIEVLDYGIFGIEEPLENAPILPPGDGASVAERMNRTTPNAAAVAGGAGGGGGAAAAAGTNA